MTFPNAGPLDGAATSEHFRTEVSANTERFVNAVAESFRDAGFEISSATADNDAVKVALRPRGDSVAAMAVIWDVPALDLKRLRACINASLRLHWQMLPKLPWWAREVDDTEGLRLAVVVSEAIDPQAKSWVYHHWLDDPGFPVIVDAATGEVVFRERPTFLGVLDWWIKRRLVRQVLVPAVAGLLAERQGSGVRKDLFG